MRSSGRHSANDCGRAYHLLWMAQFHLPHGHGLYAVCAEAAIQSVLRAPSVDDAYPTVSFVRHLALTRSEPMTSSTQNVAPPAFARSTGKTRETLAKPH